MGMRVAANFSDALLDLRDEWPDVAVKVSDWGGLEDVEAVFARGPEADFVVHLTLAMTSPVRVDDSGVVFEELGRIVPRARPDYLSAHIAFNCRVDYDAQGRYVFGERLAEGELIDNLRRNVAILEDAFGLPVVLENQVNVYGGARVPEPVLGCTTPAFINRALEATGCGLLLDLAHARVNAAFLGLDLDDYLAALPVERARELHLSGCRVTDGRLSDEHAEMSEEDWRQLEVALGRARPDCLTLEYDGEADALRRQLARLRALAASRWSP